MSSMFYTLACVALLIAASCLCKPLQVDAYTSVYQRTKRRIFQSTDFTMKAYHGTADDGNNNNNNGRKSRREIMKDALAITATISATIPTKCLAASTEKGNEDDTKQVIASRNRRVGGLANKIRKVGVIMDELQRDLMQERWDLIDGYFAQYRSYVAIFTTYTDSAFPSDTPTDKGLRVALRYEVGRFFASLERLKQATSRKALDEAYLAYSDMSLHFDRYLRVGGLYTYYDDSISTEPYFTGISDNALVYADPRRDPPLVRDLVVIIKGPDKGKTGIVIGLTTDDSDKAYVKLDRFKGIREIRVLQKSWVAKRLGEQDPDDVFLIPQKSG